MAWFLFVDESGQDHRESPYEVLAGVAVKDETLWSLIKGLNEAEISHFGRRYSAGIRELKGTKILKKKTFSLAQLNCQVLPDEVPILARESLDDGARYNSIRHLKAQALAKLAYVSDLFSICREKQCKVFASVVETDAPQTTGDGLRKDYAYLFERFFYFLEDQIGLTGRDQQGIIVFDELEKTKSHILIDQAQRYFKDTATGRHRSSLIIPEPFFVHSDLTTGVQVADLVAYVISWGFRTSGMQKPGRPELAAYSNLVSSMRYRAVRSVNSNDQWEIWSIAHIKDLRTNFER
jgi:hypothetical protein